MPARSGSVDRATTTLGLAGAGREVRVRTTVPDDDAIRGGTCGVGGKTPRDRLMANGGGLAVMHYLLST